MKKNTEKQTNELKYKQQEQNVYFTVVLTIISSNISSKHKRTSVSIKSVVIRYEYLFIGSTRDDSRNKSDVCCKS